MTPALVFLMQALFVIVVPPLITHKLRLHSVVPLVVVQILIGVALGPSVLGTFAPSVYQLIGSTSSVSTISAVSSVAVLFFLFITGMHLPLEQLRANGLKLCVISLTSTVVPGMLGILGGLWIAARYPLEVQATGTAMEYAVGVGICASVTALPVLGAILSEMRLLSQRIGHYALTIAAVSDVAVWILLGILLAMTKGAADFGSAALTTFLPLLLYLVIMYTVVKPCLERLSELLQDLERLTHITLLVACGITTISAALTEAMGLHYSLGAFVAGTIIPPRLRTALNSQIQPFVLTVLIPFYFVSTGQKAHVTFESSDFLETLAVITLTTIVGKIVGTAVVTRLSGESWSLSWGLGALTQTKGLMEVIVATILLDSGVFSTATFSAVILMAVICTTLTAPLTRLALHRNWGAETWTSGGPVRANPAASDG